MVKKVEIYSTPTCHFCQMTKEFLHEQGIPFTDHNVAADIAKRQEMIEMTGQMGVPVIKIGDEILIGFDRDKIASKIGIPT